MGVFTTVVAELSPAVVDLLPDPLVGSDSPNSPILGSFKTVNEHGLEMCAQEDNVTVESTVLESVKSAEHILPCSKQEGMTELQKLSCVQRKGMYLDEKLRIMYPSVRVSCSMYDSREVLKIQGPWESVLNVHPWLENLVDDLVVDGKALCVKSINFAMLSVCTSQSEVSCSHKISPTTSSVKGQRMCSTGSRPDNSVLEDQVNQTTDLLQTVAEGFDSYSKEDVVLQNQEIALLNQEQDQEQHAELLTCGLCSFQTNIPNLLKVHQKTIHEKTKISSSLLSVNEPLKEAMRESSLSNKKRPAEKKRRGRPPKTTSTPIKRLQLSTACSDDQNDQAEEQQMNIGSHQTFRSNDECKPTELPNQSNSDVDQNMDPVKIQDHGSNEVLAPIKQSLPSTVVSVRTPLIKREPGIPAAAAFVCDSCDYMTSKARNLVFHRARVHGERNLVCPICSKPYAMRKDLNQHLRFHTEHFCCDQCGKTLRSKYALSRHIAVVHENTKPKAGKSYLCNLCGRLCRSKTDYTIHCNKEHFGVHPHVCKVCEMRFFAKANLKIHMQVHAESRDFVCQECGKTFRQRQGLRVHLNIHKSERPYRCLLCEKTFTQRGALVRHTRTHTSDRPYSCKQCSAAFNDYSILRRHMLGIHKVEDTAVLRKTVKEACAVARDIERSRQTGICKTEATGFDTANTLIALSQQYHNPSLGVSSAVPPDMSFVPDVSLISSVSVASKTPLTKLAFEPFTVAKTFSTENFPILSLSEATIELKDISISSSSPVICFTSPSASTASMSHVTDSLGSVSFQPIMTDMVQYISLPYEHLSLGGAMQNTEHLQ